MTDKVFETNLAICVATFALFIYPLLIPIKLADEMCVLNLWKVHDKKLKTFLSFCLYNK
jgi:hypothetical protein